MLASPGIGSGLDINNIVGQLMEIERRPLTALDGKEARQQAQLTAFGSLKGALSSFQNNISALTDPAKFTAVTANFSDDAVATASASSSAIAGNFSVEVQTLAQAQKLKSENFASPNAFIGSGALTIQFGSYSDGVFTLNPDKAAQSITIPPDQASLTGVRDAINDADAGVSASIINDGSGDRLVIASKDTGLSNALKITVTDDDLNNTDNVGLSQLAFDASTGGVANLTETVAAENATLVIDGIPISKASNKISDAIEGVTLELLKADLGNTKTLSIARDTASIQEAIESFVTSFNDLNETIINLSKFDAANNQASVLTGDATLRSIQNQLRGAFNTFLSTAGGGLSTLSDIGVTFQEDGTLELDTEKLNSVLNDATKDISTLFAAVGKPSDSLVSFVNAAPETQNGSYALNVTQLATQGSATGSNAAALTINTGANDILDLDINGISTSITLAAGTYSADSLAAEIQSKINGATAISSANINVSVTQTAGVLNIISEQYGSASTVSITGGNGSTDLFGTPVETSGVDVAGTIGGFIATGSGQTLTGTDDSSGLTLQISGGTTGPRGIVDFASGFAVKLNQLVENMLENDSLIDSRIDGINSSIVDIDTQRDTLNRRLDDVERRFRAQFAALDTLVANMTQTSNFLQQQLANLPTIGDS
ncbi:flagellar filament capping protein FliD [Nitrosomonas sp.]|uniref:flagellar filament capping protein FliD n=1 Tax=Nitrosomonas sp. TaxID=42353 RepID=UPI002084ECD1|nr:flagellar filament capping protein FliD [Nitrosomonas sp.]GJL73921.1 MAG: flagellar hook-associated protein 2 [Nitrosomonas sp.]